MHEIERRRVERGRPKINLPVRTSNAQVLEFYPRIGDPHDDVISLGRRPIPDTDPDTTR
jgi:hypothetical protein